ncbi:hypothetical protein [Bacillus cereus group sp. TH152-1LC]|uniref:hypothetical protein n=1 Tax=Bacillus cereus group sp. TH152-1LC TaxID=3018060 RepID=UPI0022E8756D|nr:hypothetical protein [Bacillus cereus group sp. TH152-1LC]MDA1675224.1 hypothetical protein [Bacillus cereus group sp. TH152-1LC]
MEQLLFSVVDKKEIWKETFEEDKLLRLVQIGEVFDDFLNMEIQKISLYEEDYNKTQEKLRTLEIVLDDKGNEIVLRCIEIISIDILKLHHRLGNYVQIGGKRVSPNKVENGIALRNYIENRYQEKNNYQILNLIVKCLDNIQNEYLIKQGHEIMRGSIVLG